MVNSLQYCCLLKLQNRPINHNQGSHGVPGIFVKYDLTSLMIRIKEVHRPFWQFLVRMCGIVGGIFSVSGQQDLKNKWVSLINFFSLQSVQLRRYHSIFLVGIMTLAQCTASPQNGFILYSVLLKKN